MTLPVIDYSATELDAVNKIISMAIERIRLGLNLGGVFHLALTGGRTGHLVSEALAEEFNEEPNAYQGLHIWWGDERFVSLESEERNDFSFRSKLDNESRIHIHSVLPPEDVSDVETSAKRYDVDLQGVELDLVILGAGPDGHVASLFPGMWREDEERNAIAVSESPKPPPQRVSLSMRKINSSKRVWLLACGQNKRDLVARIRAHDLGLPANHVRAKVETLIFADSDSSPAS